MLIISERKAAHKKSSPTNALYLERQKYDEFHNLYEVLRNNPRGHSIVPWVCKVVA
jgi:hypothetical protein